MPFRSLSRNCSGEKRPWLTLARSFSSTNGARCSFVGEAQCSTQELANPPDFVADRELARRVFFAAFRSDYHVTRDGAQRVFFPRVGILAAARLAIDVSPPDGAPINTPAASAQILGVCLMMNELIAPGNVDETLDFLCHQLPYHNGTIAQRFQADLVRSMTVFEETVPLIKGQPGLLDLAERFDETVGISPRRFAELALIVGSLYLPVTQASFITDDPAFFLRREYFANTKLSEEQITAFLSLTSKSDTELAAIAASRGIRPIADTTLFQAYPLIGLPNGQYFCLDLASLLDKAGRGLYWTIAVGNADRLGGTYGKLFESYLHAQVRTNGIPTSRYLANPLFRDGAEVCDGIFVEGDRLILCEYKSSVLPAMAKVGGNKELLSREIDKNFITGDKDGRKGIAQLAEPSDVSSTATEFPVCLTASGL